LAKDIERVSERGKKSLARLASEFVFLLANPEFYPHWASWRVVIRTPEYIVCRDSMLFAQGDNTFQQ
jgi:hypothetical protein